MTATLFPFQQKAVDDLMAGKHLAIASCGSGKTAMLFNWLYRNNPRKVLIITTSSKVKSNDFYTEAIKFNGEGWTDKLDDFSVVSWHSLHKWYAQHGQNASGYYVVADEVAKAKAGVSSRMGKTFLRIVKECENWTGYTGTPGDKWIDFYAYFVAAKLIPNKTYFQRNFCNMASYRGFPEIVAYRNTEQLDAWWKQISTAPDTSQMERELPAQTHQVVTLPKPKGYDKVLKTSTTLDGEFLDSNMGLAHYLRQLCDTSDKQEWLSDFLSSLSPSSSAVIFYNYKCEADSIQKICEKNGRKVWLINGQSHQIPTAETIGAGDIVVAQYLSGGEGLNLQFINYMVMYSYNYSYSTSIQARGRIRRVGQTKPQFYWYLECEHTIEQAIQKCLKNKSDFAEQEWLASQSDICAERAVENSTKKEEKKA